MLSITTLTIASCAQETKEPLKDKSEIRYEKKKQLDTLNNSEAANLTSKLNAIQSEHNNLKFTYQIQEVVKDSSRPISVIGYITDIVQKDSIYIFKIYGFFSEKDCIFEINVSSEIFQKIFNQLDPKSSLQKVCFIFKPTSVKSSSLLTIDSEVSGGETIDDAETDLTYDFTNIILLFKGNLIDYYVYKKLPKDKN